MSDTRHLEASVVVVGGGFAGVGCAKELAKHGVPVTLLDRNNYHQFQPLLYQVATAELATTDVARPLRAIFKKTRGRREAGRGDRGRSRPRGRSPTADGQTFTGDYLVLATGSRPNFFQHPGRRGARLPAVHGRRRQGPPHAAVGGLRGRRRRPRPDRRGRAELRDRRRRPDRRRDGRAPWPTSSTTSCRSATTTSTSTGPGSTSSTTAPWCSRAFSDKAHAYAADKLRAQRRAAQARAPASRRSRRARSMLSDGTEILTRTVVWAGGIQAPELAGDAGPARRAEADG